VATQQTRIQKRKRLEREGRWLTPPEMAEAIEAGTRELSEQVSLLVHTLEIVFRKELFREGGHEGVVH